MASPTLDPLLDPRQPGADEIAALGLDPRAYYRAIALPGSATIDGPSSVVETSVGAVRFAVRSIDAADVSGRAGIGLAVMPSALDRSFASALLALRLTGRNAPVLRAENLAGLLIVLEAADAGAGDHADLLALKILLRSQPQALRTLEALATTATVRAVSAATGVHPDTVRERARLYLRALGFDVLTAQGRTRLTIALALFRLQTNRFQ